MKHASTSTTPQMRLETGERFLVDAPRPGLLLAHSPARSGVPDRFPISERPLVVGRGAEADWQIPDARLSKRHARFWCSGDVLLAEDLSSTNGTFLGGARLSSRAEILRPGDVLRCGRVIFSVTADLGGLASPVEDAPAYGFAGRFHSPAILATLLECAAVGRHILLTGDSGTGKELAAAALAAALAERGEANGGILAHNCAHFANEEEATSTIFGVGAHVFSGVKARAGLIERAAGGVLFLDEFHALPLRVQQSLLRFVEDGQHSRVGETDARPVDVFLVLGTNRDPEEAIARGQIAFDLVNRLQQAYIPPLNERRADVPDLFFYHLRVALRRHGLDPQEVIQTVRPAHLEAICLLDYSQRNVREVIQLAELLAARISTRRVDPQTALGRILSERYPENPVVRRALSESGALGRQARSAAAPRLRDRGETAARTDPVSDPALSPPAPPFHSAGGQMSPVDGLEPAGRPPPERPFAPLSDLPLGRPGRDKPVSRYEINKEAIIQAYRLARGNLSETARILKSKGYPGSRRWLAKYLRKWGVR